MNDEQTKTQADTTDAPSGTADSVRCNDLLSGDKIVCGDNCDVMGQLPRECIDLVVTSPPYDDAREYGGFVFDFDSVRRNLCRIIKDGAIIVWVVSDTSRDHCESLTSFKQAIAFVDGGMKLLDTMIYRKKGEFPRHGHRVYPQVHEYMFVFSRGRPKTLHLLRDKPNSYAGKKYSPTLRCKDGSMKKSHSFGRIAPEMGARGNVWEYEAGFRHSSTDTIAHKHPAIFPEALARDHILSWSNPGDIVLDPFNGSGTTTKMARELGRKFLGIEINEEYCEIARKRIEQQLLFA